MGETADISGQRYATQPIALVVFRVVGYFALGVAVLFLPALGEMRYWLSGALLVVAVPAIAFVAWRYRTHQYSWLEPLMDLAATILCSFIFPELWMPIFCIGLMIALAPSLSLHPKSYRLYGLYGICLLLGMGASAVLHAVEGWGLVVLATSVVYPSVIFYAQLQARRAELLRERSDLMRHMYQLSGSVAHDFNNVMTGISGYVELATQQVDADHVAQADLAEALAGVARAKLICQQLLSFATHRKDVQQLLDLNAELKSLAALYEPLMTKKTVLEFCPSHENVSIISSRSEFQRVILHILLNADSSLQGAVVRLSTARREINERYWAEITLAEVVDDAAADKQASDLWFSDQTAQLDVALDQVKNYVQASDGALDLQINREFGYRAVIRLPLAPSRPQPARVPVIDRPAEGIALVIDDEAQIRTVAESFLRKTGFDVVTAEDADAGVAALRKHALQISVVVLDLKMPGKDGWSCLEEIRAIDPSMPVVICSGFDPDSSRRSQFGEPLGFVNKPFRSEELQSAVLQIAKTSGAHERDDVTSSASAKGVSASPEAG